MWKTRFPGQITLCRIKGINSFFRCARSASLFWTFGILAFPFRWKKGEDDETGSLGCRKQMKRQQDVYSQIIYFVRFSWLFLCAWLTSHEHWGHSSRVVGGRGMCLSFVLHAGGGVQGVVAWRIGRVQWQRAHDILAHYRKRWEPLTWDFSLLVSMYVFALTQ